MEQLKTSPTLSTRSVTAGAILFWMGIAVSLVLAALTTWPNLEASLFDVAISSDESLRSLSCPLFVTRDETTAIHARFDNPLERPIQFLVRARISSGSATAMRRTSTVVALEPGESTELVWPISAADAAYGRIVMARVYSFRSFEVPSRQRACGALVLNVPGLTGNQIVAGLLGTGLLGIMAGGGLWLRAEWPLRGRRRELARPLAVLTGLVFVTVAVALYGSWAGGLVGLILIALYSAAMAEHYVIRPGR